MKLEFLGGAQEIGRSAILVNDRLLLDFGIKSDRPPSYPVQTPDPDAVVVSHGHLDHVGAVPALFAAQPWPSVHLTPPTARLLRVLGEDTLKLHGGTPHCRFTEVDLKRVTQSTHRHGYDEPFEAAGHEITFFDAGHIPGSAHVLVDDGDTRLLYTGDFTLADQQLLAGSTARPDADVVLCESTYSTVSRPDRSVIEEEFIDFIKRRLWDGGTVLVPAFAIGRTQEVLALLAAAGIDCYVDGMGTRVARLFEEYSEYLHADRLRAGTRNARFVTGRDGQRRRIAEQNTVIVTTAGMLQGGPAMTYLPALRSNPTNGIALAGYQVDGTPGRELVDTGRIPIEGRHLPVSAQVQQFDLSAHADRGGLETFLEEYSDSQVLINHGDRTTAFAEELRTDGFEATAPAVGDVVSL